MSRDHPFLPILLTLFGVASLSLMDALMKGASLALGAYTAAWLRSAIGLAIILPWWLATGYALPNSAVLRVHILRGVVSTLMALSFFYALTKLPIAEAIAISFVAPLMALYLARVLLGERIRREAIWASIIGFVGTLVIIAGRIGQSTIDTDLLLGLAAIVLSALLYAWNFVIIRQQSQLAGPVEIAVFHSGVSSVLLGIGIPFLFVSPDLATLAELGSAAILTIVGAMAFAWAYAREEAQTLVPLEYSAFLWAALFGWLFFRETVSVTTIAGTVLIVGGCWLATRRKVGAEPIQP